MVSHLWPPSPTLPVTGPKMTTSVALLSRPEPSAWLRSMQDEVALLHRPSKAALKRRLCSGALYRPTGRPGATDLGLAGRVVAPLLST